MSRRRLVSAGRQEAIYLDRQKTLIQFSSSFYEWCCEWSTLTLMVGVVPKHDTGFPGPCLFCVGVLPSYQVMGREILDFCCSARANFPWSSKKQIIVFFVLFLRTVLWVINADAHGRSSLQAWYRLSRTCVGVSPWYLVKSKEKLDFSAGRQESSITPWLFTKTNLYIYTRE